jgi:hypothetical protein
MENDASKQSVTFCCQILTTHPPASGKKIPVEGLPETDMRIIA